MATSLKIFDMDEILASIEKSVGSRVKNASGPALEAYRDDLVGVKNENDLINTWNKHMDALNQEESTNEALKLQAEKAKELGLPGYSTPLFNDDGMEEMPAGEPAGEAEQMAWDEKDKEAAVFAFNHLVKMADVLDQKGCRKVSDILDKTLQELSRVK